MPQGVPPNWQSGVITVCLHSGNSRLQRKCKVGRLREGVCYLRRPEANHGAPERGRNDRMGSGLRAPFQKPPSIHTPQRGRCHGNQERWLLQWRPVRTGYDPDICRQAEVSPFVSTGYLSRFPSDTTRTVFRLPVELIVEIITYFEDPHHNILSAKTVRGARRPLDPEDVERLTVIRKLTMTCWHLRNKLFPFLWECVEGCDVVRYRPAHRRCTVGNGLYSQCAYLILNPTIGAYVQCVRSVVHGWELTRCRFTGLCS